MRTVKLVETQRVVGKTVGIRKDGTVAVLFLDVDLITWYSAATFASTFEVV